MAAIFSSFDGLGLPFILAGLFILLLLLENLLPLRPRSRSLGKRILTNAVFSALAFAAGAGVVKPLALEIIGWSETGSFGLLRIISLPPAVQIAVGFLLMDMTFYYWHRLNHESSLLWRFHRAHHVDPDLDVTTSFRFHVAEILYSAIFRAVQVALIGVSPLIYAVYEGALQCATMFHHSNLSIPLRLERLINTIVVTPRMHGVHHSIRKQEVNSNYSVVFRWWDWLHRTLRLNVPQKSITIGVAGRRKERDNRISDVLVLPFRGERVPQNGPAKAAALTEEKGYEGSRTTMAQ